MSLDERMLESRRIMVVDLQVICWDGLISRFGRLMVLQGRWLKRGRRSEGRDIVMNDIIVTNDIMVPTIDGIVEMHLRNRDNISGEAFERSISDHITREV